jgi:hypothetical protein
LQKKIEEELDAFVKDPAYRSFNAAVTAVVCGDSADGGCVCDYDLVVSGGPSGRYSHAGSTLTFFDDQFRPPVVSDYCASANSLDISSEHQTRLFNKADLRTTTWSRPSCQDGVQSLSLGETGIDCGGSCAPCPVPATPATP